MQLIKNIFSGIASLFIISCAVAQTNTHFVKGTLSEKVIAEIWVNKVSKGKSRKIAEYKVTPDDGNFVFAIPKDPGAAYRLQINLYKPGGRHPKLDKVCVLPLSLTPDLNYTLNITPSKLDTLKKKGWELKQDTARSSLALIRGKIVNAKQHGQISLQHVVDGALVSRNSFITNSEGAFEIPCQVKQEGFYYLSTLR